MKKQNEIEIKTQDKIKPPKEYVEIESANFIKFENINDTLEGILTSRDKSSRFGFGLYTLCKYNGEQVRFHGSSQLDDLLLNIEIPSYIKIIYIDNQATPNGSMKLFKVFKGEYFI